MKRIYVYILLLYAMSGLVGCGEASPTISLPSTNTPAPTPILLLTQTPKVQVEEKEVIQVWYHTGAENLRLSVQAAVETVNAQQDDYIYEYIQLPEGNYNEQVEAAALAGELPCLLDFDGPFVYKYAWSGYLLPLDQFVSEELKADILPSILAQGTYNGRLYSLGQIDSGLAIYGNRSYLEAAGLRMPTIEEPWDLTEFEDALEKLTALEQVEYALDMKIDYGIGEWFTYGFSPILQSFGGDLIDRSDYHSAQGVLDGPASVEAMTHFQSWFEKGWANPSPESDDDFQGTKKAALSWVGHWVYPQYAEGLGDDLVLLPMPDFGHGPKTGLGSWNWGISSSCPNPQAAWDLLAYLMSSEQIIAHTEGAGAVPARKTALAQSELYNPDGGPLYLYVQQIEAGWAVPRPQTPAYGAITKAFAKAVGNIVKGADVQEELTRAAIKIDQDIEEHQGYPVTE